MSIEAMQREAMQRIWDDWDERQRGYFVTLRNLYTELAKHGVNYGDPANPTQWAFTAVLWEKAIGSDLAQDVKELRKELREAKKAAKTQ